MKLLSEPTKWSSGVHGVHEFTAIRACREVIGYHSLRRQKKYDCIKGYDKPCWLELS